MERHVPVAILKECLGNFTHGRKLARECFPLFGVHYQRARLNFEVFLPRRPKVLLHFASKTERAVDGRMIKDLVDALFALAGVTRRFSERNGVLIRLVHQRLESIAFFSCRVAAGLELVDLEHQACPNLSFPLPDRKLSFMKASMRLPVLRPVLPDVA